VAVDPTAANALVLGQRYPESLKPTRSRASFGGSSRDTPREASRDTPREASPSHETVLRDAHLDCPPKSRWRNFSSPFHSATPALFDRLRSSGGELRRAPLSVNLRG
jgi:hypothetical protein